MGIDEAKGKIIFFIDADCIAPLTWMVTLLRSYMEGHKVVGGPVWFEKSAYWILCDNVAHFHDLLPDVPRGPNQHFTLATANLMMEKSVIDRVGKFNNNFPPSEDFEFAMRIREAGYKLFFEPAASIIHRPMRNSLKAVLGHSSGWARQSIRIRTRYHEIMKTPWILSQPMALRFLSPAIAATVTAKVFFKHPCVRCYWYTAPVVFLTKLVWCWAAAKELAAIRHE